MKVKMKEFEKWCGEYSERWNKKQLWDSYILVQDAWLNGYKKAKEEAIKTVSPEGLPSIFYLGEAEIEVELPSNQIGQDK